jgi:hypothetical protein
MGLATFTEYQTAGYFKEASLESVGDAFANHRGGGKYDFAFGPNRNDRWRISGRTYNAHEFGNVLAGYVGGYKFGESSGSAVVETAGFFANIGDNGLGGDGDKSSRPYINLGAKLGASDAQTGRAGVCACNGK